MPDSNYFSGAITITPPLNTHDINDRCPGLRDLKLRIDRTEETSVEGESVVLRITEVADALIPDCNGLSGRNIEPELARMLNAFPDREFAGYIEVEYPAGAYEQPRSRYIIEGRTVRQVYPQLVWPEGNSVTVPSELSESVDREPWAIDVTLELANRAKVLMRGTSWIQSQGGWTLGGHIKDAPDWDDVDGVRVHYPDGTSELVELCERPQAHARTGHPYGTFTTFAALNHPRWPGAAAQHEAMLQQLRDEGFSIEGDD